MTSVKSITGRAMLVGIVASLLPLYGTGFSQESAQSAPASGVATPDSRLPCPPDAKVDEDVKLIRAAYEAAYDNAKDTGEPDPLIEQLVGLFNETPDPAKKYALLLEAESVATQYENYATALDLLAKRAEKFQIDGLKLKGQLLKRLAGPKVAADLVLFDQASETAEQAVQVERFDIAAEAAALALSVAKAVDREQKAEARKRGRPVGKAAGPMPVGPGLVKKATALQSQVTATQKLFAEYGEALADIKSQPNEAAANSVVAQYLCFVRGDWQSGLPAMAKCDLESLKSVAAEEIALLTTEKSEPKKGFALAGKWWAAADKHENVSGSGDAIRLHAASIYHDVLQSLQDPLERRLAENRIEPYKAVVAVKSREGVRTSSEVFLSDLEERDPFVGYGVFGKNGELGYEGLKIVVGGQVSPKGISVHPFSGGTSRVTYKVPEGCTHFEGRAAIADGRKPQQTAVIFRVLNERDDVLWKSRPILGKGAGEECSIALNGAKTVTLTVECPGIFDYAYAVWVDPVLLWQGSTLTNAARSSLVLPGKANEKFDFNGHAYWFPEEQTNQIQAKLAAEKVGGVLVVIDDEAENNFIAQHVRGTSWIGIRKSANGLMPVSGGGKITYSSWDHKAGQPSNFAGETAVSTSQAGLWHDHFATDELYYVVEWPYELPRNSGTASVSNNPVQPPPERLRDQKGMDPRVLKELEKEFESAGRDDWWWLNKANPGQKEKWYRLNLGKNRWEHFFKDKNGKPQVYGEFSATYEILGLDKADQDIILVKMTYPPKGAEPGDQAILRFSRKTGVIDSPWGWYAEPKKKKD